MTVSTLEEEEEKLGVGRRVEELSPSSTSAVWNRYRCRIVFNMSRRRLGLAGDQPGVAAKSARVCRKSKAEKLTLPCPLLFTRVDITSHSR